MTEPTIAFIGAGNMASSIIGGLITKGFTANKIIAADPSATHLSALKGLGAITTTENNDEAAKQADVVVLAVKPQILKAVACDLAPALVENKPLVISIAAGIESSALASWLGSDIPVVRCMPNTPALVQKGATGLYAAKGVSDTQKTIAQDILDAVGITLWVNKEEDIDAVTAVSGSGPAYFFLVMESMIEAGTKLGLSKEDSAALTLQTALGAAEMAISSDVDAAELRRRVTSPGGTTEQAVKTFEAGGLKSLFEEALTACAEKSKTLAKELK